VYVLVCAATWQSSTPAAVAVGMSTNVGSKCRASLAGTQMTPTQQLAETGLFGGDVDPGGRSG